MQAVSTEVKSVQEIVKERLGGSIAGLIPDEVWNKMIDSGVEQLLAKREQPNPITGVKGMYSELEIMIWKEQVKQVAEIVKVETSKPEWLQQWNGSYHGAGEGIKEAIGLHADQFVKMFVINSFSDTVQASVMEMRNRMQNGRY